MFGRGAGVGEGQVVRQEGFLAARAVADLLRDPENFDIEPVARAVAAAFGPVGHIQHRVSRLGPGEGLAAVLPPGAAGGFVLDLDPPQWRSEWGGLLLFQEGEGRVRGYRPTPGALTLFQAGLEPLISLVMLRAPARVALRGWWA